MITMRPMTKEEHIRFGREICIVVYKLNELSIISRRNITTKVVR